MPSAQGVNLSMFYLEQKKKKNLFFVRISYLEIEKIEDGFI